MQKVCSADAYDIPASKTALLLNLNRNTINYWYMLF
ncbi:IS1595 family transposase, partial [Acinetobacter towneri]|nr:IS1595 family transposase [Acinetobacter towneri]